MAWLLASCSSSYISRDGGPDRQIDVSRIPNAVPRPEARSRYGNPDSYVVGGHRYYVKQSSAGYVARGIASWYGTKFHGRRTSSGEPYDMYAMTAAHKTLPLPTYVRVTNLQNGRSVIVKVNDRGPFHEDRIIDLSYVAARKLGMIATGTAPVEVRAIDPYAPNTRGTQTASYSPPPDQPAADNDAELYLQVGAFASRYNAEQLTQKLRSISLPGIQISEGVSNQHPIYRVRIGPLASVEEADRMAQTLTKFGIHSPRVVID